MRELITILKSTKPQKKFMALFIVDGKELITHFGQNGSTTYVEGADELKRLNYLKRHKIREDWNNPFSSGSLSRWILWEYRDINEAVKHFKNRFNL